MSPPVPHFRFTGKKEIQRDIDERTWAPVRFIITGYDAAGKQVYEGRPPVDCMYPVEEYVEAAQRYYGAVKVSVEQIRVL